VRLTHESKRCAMLRQGEMQRIIRLWRCVPHRVRCAVTVKRATNFYKNAAPGVTWHAEQFSRRRKAVSVAGRVLVSASSTTDAIVLGADLLRTPQPYQAHAFGPRAYEGQAAETMVRP